MSKQTVTLELLAILYFYVYLFFQSFSFINVFKSREILLFTKHIFSHQTKIFYRLQILNDVFTHTSWRSLSTSFGVNIHTYFIMSLQHCTVSYDKQPLTYTYACTNDCIKVLKLTWLRAVFNNLSPVMTKRSYQKQSEFILKRVCIIF